MAASEGQIRLPSEGRQFSPPPGDGLWARFMQIWWAWEFSRSIPGEDALLAGQPHLGLGIWFARKNFSQFIHGGEWENYPGGRLILRRFLKVSELVIFNSEATKNRTLGSSPHPESFILRPGLPDFVSIGRPKPKRVGAIPQASTSLSVLCVARLSPRKGHERLIRSVTLCNQIGYSVNLRIIGSGARGPELRRLVADHDFISLESGLSDEQLREAYASADVFALLPEQIAGGEGWEGFGIVYLEAAASGLPILATDSGGTAEAIHPNGAVLLNQDCDDVEILRALVWLCDHPSDRARMAKQNLEWARRNTWSQRQTEVRKLTFTLKTSRGLS